MMGWILFGLDQKNAEEHSLEQNTMTINNQQIPTVWQCVADHEWFRSMIAYPSDVCTVSPC
jgi:hypothetical protein